MESREYDVNWLADLALPYDSTTKQLDDKHNRIVSGLDMWVTLGGHLAQRPTVVAGTAVPFTNIFRTDHMWIFESQCLDNASVRSTYLLCSIQQAAASSWWELYAIRPGAIPADPYYNWVKVLGTDLDHSTTPHEIVIARGQAFVRYTPEAGLSKEGTLRLITLGAAASLASVAWGNAVPTAAHAPRFVSAAASTLPVTVRYGWKYTAVFGFSVTGDMSCRTPPPVVAGGVGITHNTGPLTNQKPTIGGNSAGLPATYDQIHIFRTTDGGGTPYFLETIANPVGVYTYTDNHLEPANTNNPKSDLQLDINNVAPDFITNMPPPPVGVGKIAGTDTPERGTPQTYYAKRIWYAIGHRLYFSAQEEVANGVPECCFVNPQSVLGGNYIDFQTRVVAQRAISDRQYIMCTTDIHEIRGEEKINFTPRRVSKEFGMNQQWPDAIGSLRDVVFFLTPDAQVAMLSPGSQPIIISDPIAAEFLATVQGGTSAYKNVQFLAFTKRGYELLLILIVDRLTPTNTRIYTFDLKRQIWYTPWYIPATAMTFGRLRATDIVDSIILAVKDPALSDSGVSYICGMDLTSSTTEPYGSGPVCSAILNVATLPSGNHINEFRKPGHHPMLAFVVVERTKTAGDTEPTVTFRLDEFSGTLRTMTGFDPPFTAQHTSYETKWFPVQELCQRVQLSLNRPATATYRLEFQNIGFVFQSEAGT